MCTVFLKIHTLNLGLLGLIFLIAVFQNIKGDTQVFLMRDLCYKTHQFQKVWNRARSVILFAVRWCRYDPSYPVRISIIYYMCLSLLCLINCRRRWELGGRIYIDQCFSLPALYTKYPRKKPDITVSKSQLSTCNF